MKKILFALCACLCGMAAQAQVSTPGTGVRWTFDSLANNFPATVVRLNTDTFRVKNIVNIQPTDTLFEGQFAYVLIDSGATFNFRKCGVWLNTVFFAASDTNKKFLRMRMDSVTNGRWAFTEMNYGKGLSLINSRMVFTACRFGKNAYASSDPSGALSLLGSYAEIDNTVFRENARSAINVAANGNSGMKVISCNFLRNNTENGNYPQINIGNASDSGIVIHNCNIRGRSARGGGIGFLNLLNSNYRIDIRDNTIYGNRYGIAVTGRGISGVISYNVIDSNCIENNPALGGSGLNFQGDSSLRIIVRNNIIRQNLWGATIQLSSATARAPQVSFGRVTPSDPDDVGGNTFSANGNNGQLYAIYNNTHDTIWAQNNRWDDTSAAGIENTVFHHVDSAALGWVIFTPFVVPPPAQGVITVSGSEDVQLWPNPVKSGGMILVRAKSGLRSYRLYSVGGQAAAGGAASGTQLAVPTAGLPAGTYYLALSGQDWKKIIPLIIQ